jgi:predicted transcriptional regulator
MKIIFTTTPLIITSQQQKTMEPKGTIVFRLEVEALAPSGAKEAALREAKSANQR